MPVRKEDRVSQWVSALRGWVPTVRVRLTEWWIQVREEPSLIWQAPAVRYGALVAGLFVLVTVVTWTIEAVTPPLPKGATGPARTAHFHVICTNPVCGHHFVIERKFKFDDFPVSCPRCGQKTGYHAERSTSGPNQGEWVIQQ